MPDVKDESRAALLAGIGCYSIWGLLPLWMYALRDAWVGAVEITAQRAWHTLWIGADRTDGLGQSPAHPIRRRIRRQQHQL